jgi:WD40 repeat protein
MLRRLALVALLALPAADAAGQVYIDPLAPSQNPPGLDWRRIRTPHYEVVFPRQLEPDAQRVANTLEHVYASVTHTLGVSPRRLTVILQNQGTTSNGFVTLAPRRSEWFTTPPQTNDLLGPNDWYDLLAVHEYRHVAQFELSKTGLTRLFYYLFGETSWQVLTHYSVPSWFLEGDAVGTETALTSGGRGRIGEFDETLRALTLGGVRYSYWESLWRSYDDFVPNAYILGYALTTHVKRKYGADAWAKVLRRTAAISIVPNAFSIALHHVTGKGAGGIYREALAELDSTWRAQLVGLDSTTAERLTTPTRDSWTSDFYPQLASDGSIIAARGGYEDIPQIVRIDPVTKKAERLAVAGQYALGDPIGVGGSLITWNETRYDPRWGQRTWSVIRGYDLATRQARTITHETRLFAPAPSPDGKRIAAVEYPLAGPGSIVVIDAETGKEVARLANPDSAVLQAPRWSPDGRSLVYVAIVRGKGRGILMADVDGGSPRVVVPFGTTNVTAPVTDGQWVYYSAPHSGIDDVYATELPTPEAPIGRTFQITRRTIGAHTPWVSADGRTLLFTEATKEGNAAFRQAVDTAAWTALERVENRSVRYYEPLIAQEGSRDVLADVPSGRYPVARYNPLAHLVDIVEWSPFATSDERLAGLALYSRDKLGTLQGSIGALYNWNERTVGGFATASYGGFYPMLDAGGQYTDRSTSFIGADDREQVESWHEGTGTFGVRLPFNLTTGLYGTSLSLGASVSGTHISGKDTLVVDPLDNGDGQLTSVTYEASFGHAYQWIRDIRPPWGQYLIASYSHTPFRGTYQGQLLSTQGFLFAPGPFPHHSLALRVGYERQRPGNYVYSSRMAFPRGYSSRIHRDFYELSGSYALPLAYPDLNILQTVTIRRLRSTAFYDWGRGSGRTRDFYYRSAGLEGIADFYLFHYPLQLFGGVRVSRVFDDPRRSYVVEPIIGLPF